MRDKLGRFIKNYNFPKEWKRVMKGKNNPFYKKHHFNKTKERIRKLTKKRLKENKNFGFQKGHKINIGRPSPFKGKKRPNFSREKHWNWHGGRVIHKSGYVQIYMPNHPHKSMRCYVPEHRLIMEKILKRYLKSTEIVHHKNGNRYDNRPKNLELVVYGKNWHPKICPKCNFKFLIK